MRTLLEPVLTSKAPAPIGPYSQAVRAGDMLFCSGQIALDPASGALKNESLELETRQVLSNLHEVLSAADCTFAHVLKTTIFLLDMKDFGEVNSIYEEVLGTARPARSTVAVVGLPKGARVEIECVAYIGV